MRRLGKVVLAVALVACAEEPPAPPGEAPAPEETAAARNSATAAAEAADADVAWPDPAAGWTTERVEGAADTGMATLRAVRAARHESHDRVVLEFGAGLVPGYRAEHVASPQQQCGSGDDVFVEGQAWLRLDLEPARAHDDQGRATVTQRSFRPGLPGLLEVRMLCDFEGQVAWVLGLRRAGPFRLLRLENPARLVVDVRH